MTKWKEAINRLIKQLEITVSDTRECQDKR